jgi:hypothetical protein
MDVPAARALLVAISLQESQLQARRQTDGPARSYFQFEPAGIAGVLQHHSSALHAAQICLALDVQASVSAVYRAIEFQDTLACVFARLLLWTLPDQLPTRDDVNGAWRQYLAAWRPGKPRAEDWPENYERAWTALQGVIQLS